MRATSRRPLQRLLAMMVLVVCPASAFAQVQVDVVAAQAMSDRYFCSACHANDRTMVGPGFVAIAKKYKGDPAAPALLARKVKEGGVGVWGQIPMPPNPTVSDPEMQQLVAWILSLE